MHAYLITGGTREERDTYVSQLLKTENIVETDCVHLQPETGSIAIESVRNFVKQLLLSPRLSPKTAGIIPDADSMTPQSQNALLKTLEEPPPHSIIILHTVNYSTLLTTIVSRCIHIPLGRVTIDKTDTALADTLLTITTLSLGKRLLYVDSIAGTKEEVSAWIDTSIKTLQSTLVENLEDKTLLYKSTKLIRALTSAQRKLMLNIAPKTVLDSVVLDFPNDDTTGFLE